VYDQIKKANPKLIQTIDSLGFVLKLNNLLAECEELGITISSDKLDIETIKLCYILRKNLKELNKSKEEKKSGGRRGRR